jgi:hypothetical protein
VPRALDRLAVIFWVPRADLAAYRGDVFLAHSSPRIVMLFPEYCEWPLPFTVTLSSWTGAA